MKNFSGKNVVITGGATGIGLALAKQFGKQGANVIIAGRRVDRLEEAVNILAGQGMEARYYQCDVANRESVEALAEFAWQVFGQVDVLINNAGVPCGITTLIDTPMEEIQQLYSVNLFGVINGIQVFGKRFIEQGSEAAIYNVGSENSLFNAVPLASSYVSSKHALLGLTEALSEEVPDFIAVGLICPGFVKSEIGPEAVMKNGMDTDKYAALVMEQMCNEEFFIVSHAFNMERIDARYQRLSKAYEQYAPRYEGDAEFDIREMMSM